MRPKSETDFAQVDSMAAAFKYRIIEALYLANIGVSSGYRPRLAERGQPGLDASLETAHAPPP
jgi:hypothetical protein